MQGFWGISWDWFWGDGQWIFEIEDFEIIGELLGGIGEIKE